MVCRLPLKHCKYSLLQTFYLNLTVLIVFFCLFFIYLSPFLICQLLRSYGQVVLVSGGIYQPHIAKMSMFLLVLPSRSVPNYDVVVVAIAILIRIKLFKLFGESYFTNIIIFYLKCWNYIARKNMQLLTLAGKIKVKRPINRIIPDLYFVINMCLQTL